MLRSRPGAATARDLRRETTGDVVSRDRSATPQRVRRLWWDAALVRTYRSRHKWPMGLLSFGRLLRQLSPLERSHGQQGASTLGVCELGKPIALRRFAQAIFIGFHVPPKA